MSSLASKDYSFSGLMRDKTVKEKELQRGSFLPKHLLDLLTSLPALKSIEDHGLIKGNDRFQELIESTKSFDENRTKVLVKPTNNLQLLRDRIVGLARLPFDWHGEGSIVPEQKIIDDFMWVLTSLPYNVKMPEIEIDDGSVSLEWGSENNSASFALDCSGTGRVVGTLVSVDKTQQQAWRLEVTDYNDLANKLAAPLIRDLLTGEL